MDFNKLNDEFKQIAAEIKLNNDDKEKQLTRLKQWCFENISTDINYSGTTLEQLDHYIKLGHDFIDLFLSSISDNIAVDLPYEKIGEQMNAIQYAALKGYDRYLETLDLSSSQWNKVTAAQMTALHFAALEGHVRTVKLLLAKGASPTVLNADNQYPIFNALTMPMSAANSEDDLKKRKEEIFNIFLSEMPEGSLTFQDKSEMSLLHLMAQFKFASLLKETLAKDEKLALIRDESSRYPIHTAMLATPPDLAIVEQLIALNNGASLSDGEDRIALHYAGLYGNRKLIELCCKYTSDLNALDCEQKTALQLAMDIENTEAVETINELLQKNKSSVSPSGYRF